MSDSQNPQPTPEPGDTIPPQPPPAPEPVPPIGYAAGGTPVPKDADDRNMGMLCHLLALFTSVIGPLIVWLMKKDTSPFVDNQGKEALNFQITILIAYVVSFVLTFVCIGYILMPAVIVFDVVVVIIATVKASQGIAYRYPFCLRLVS